MRTVAASLLLALTLAACGPQATYIPGGRLGELRLFTPETSVQAVVLWLGARTGWSAADEAAAWRLAADGTIVAAVDLPVYMTALEKERGTCLYLVGDAEAAARLIERHAGLDRYLSPILAGVGEGGRLAIAMLRQAPPATLAGAVAIDPMPDAKTTRPICRQPPRNVGMPEDPKNKSIYVAFSRRADSDGEAAAIMAALSQVELRPTSEPISSAPSAEEALADLILRHLPMGREVGGAAADLSDLPLIELPAEPGAPLVVVLSGDGGWRDIDRRIAESLHRRGYAVVGWDSLRYFWHAKTPGALAHDLARVLLAYQARWQTSRIVLVGYSFGADVLPFAFNRLPVELRRSVVQISLLGYVGRADFEIRVAGWLGAAPSDAAVDGAQEIAQIDPQLVQCFYGVEESDSACPRLKGRGVAAIETGGGHHFGGDYAKLAQRIASGIAARPLAERTHSAAMQSRPGPS
jgi:type IV secretory pathway VirJ component